MFVVKEGGNDWAKVILSVKIPHHMKKFDMTFNFTEYLSKNKVVGKTEPTPYDLIEKAQLVLIEEGILFGTPMLEMVLEGM